MSLGNRPYLSVVVFGAAAGCAGCLSAEPALPPPPGAITSVTFNIAGETINDAISGPAIARQIAELRPDFGEIQECLCDRLLDMLPDTYRLVSGRSDSEVGILYAADRWQELDAGVLDLGNDDGWGNRIVRWAKMGYIGTDSGVYVYATHFCVPIRPSEDRCDVDRQVAHARRIVEHIESHDSAAILGGDFNVFDGFEEGPVVSFFKGHGLVDVLREVTAQPVITFEGNDWAPAGRIDYLFATRGVHVSAASVGEGSGSDHRFVAGTMLFE